MNPTILTNDLEQMMCIAEDIKKKIGRDKMTGTWYWVDKSDDDNIEEYHTGFKTFYSALKDAVAPYMEDVGNQ